MGHLIPSIEGPAIFSSKLAVIQGESHLGACAEPPQIFWAIHGDTLYRIWPRCCGTNWWVDQPFRSIAGGFLMSHSHHPLGSWHVDENGLRPGLDRRVLFRSALGAGAAAALLESGTAHALTVEKVPPAVLGAIPPRYWSH
jgi:hypothetical protein